MNFTALKTQFVSQLKQRPLLFAGAGAVLLLALILTLRPGRSNTSSPFYTVKRGNFLISIVEGGTIQAVSEVNIRNEVEGTARIIFIAPEGTYVKKGDLLVELDSASAQDQANKQMIDVEKADFALIQAKEQLQIQKSMVDSDVRAADLKLEFARTDLKKYIQGEAMQERRKAENEITSIMEKLAIDEDRLKWSKELHEEGFETKSTLDQHQLTLMQTKLNLQMATNALWMIEQFDFPKKRRQSESNVEEAQQELERVKHQGASRLAQYQADARTQEITLELSKSKLDRDKKQLASAKIYAPQDGLVVYPVGENRFSSESLIEEGATVRNRQTLIKLPDTSEMKLSVKIHESHVNMISLGLPAFVVLDSMPDQRIRAVVNKVGLLPDTQSRWGNPNLKLYATELLIQDNLPDVKPGVSARAEIIVTNLENVISVPLQAVTTKQGRQVVYLGQGTDSKAIPVQVGLYNTKFIEITSGLKEGDRILLAPPFDSQEKDLGGAVLAEGEAAAATNLLATAPLRTEPARNRASTMDIAPASPEQTEATAGGPQPQRQERSQGTGPEGGPRFNPAEMLKQYDKNGDGQLDEGERQAMRAAMGDRSRQGGGGGTNRVRRSEGGGQTQSGPQGPGGQGDRGGRSRREGRPEAGRENAEGRP